MTDIAEVLADYANVAPLALLGAARIQSDLLAISGAAHPFVGGKSDHPCELCARSYSNLCHVNFGIRTS